MTQPKEQTICPQCERPYTFTRCRVTDSKGDSHCLSCGVEMEKAKRV